MNVVTWLFEIKIKIVWFRCVNCAAPSCWHGNRYLPKTKADGNCSYYVTLLLPYLNLSSILSTKSACWLVNHTQNCHSESYWTSTLYANDRKYGSHKNFTRVTRPDFLLRYQLSPLLIIHSVSPLIFNICASSNFFIRHSWDVFINKSLILHESTLVNNFFRRWNHVNGALLPLQVKIMTTFLTISERSNWRRTYGVLSMLWWVVGGWRSCFDEDALRLE